MLHLAILYEAEGGTLPVVTLTDSELIRRAATTAINDRRREAEDLSRVDHNLGVIAAEEARRLERTLAALIGEGLTK